MPVKKYEATAQDFKRKSRNKQKTETFIDLMNRTRFFVVAIWPIIMVAVLMFMIGVFGGFDRRVLFVYFKELVKFIFGVIITLFIAVDASKTFNR